MIDSLSNPESCRREPAPNGADKASADLAELDISVDDARWMKCGDVRTQLSDAFCATLAVAGPSHASGVAISVLLTNDAHMCRLNERHRGRNKATNVLSFPMVARPQVLAGDHNPPGMPLPLGDIALSLETLTREAAENRRPFEDHLTHLAVHGLLHLLGHDHLHDEEAEAMERLEAAILGTLGICDPYEADADRASTPHARLDVPKPLSRP